MGSDLSRTDVSLQPDAPEGDHTAAEDDGKQAPKPRRVVAVPVEDRCRKKVKDVIYAWLTGIKERRSPKTWAACAWATKQFLLSSSKVYLDELERGDITRFENYMRQAENSDRTIFNCVTFLRSLLNWADRGVVMAKFELPRYTEKVVSAYEAHELHKMLSVGDTEDRSYLQFLVGTGFREGEAMHAT